MPKPKFSPDNVPSLLREALVNDSQEVNCYECDELLEVEGHTYDVDYVDDRFNGSSWVQSESWGREFDSEFICPNCNHHNKIEGKQI